MQINSSIIYDQWLTSFLGKAAYRIEFVSVEDSGNSYGLSDLSGKEDKIFAYSKVPCTAFNEISWLENKGFHLIDTNVTFSKHVNHHPHFSGNCSIDFADPLQQEKISELASSSFSFSRFHLDPAIPENVANKIKSAWVSNYFLGRRGDYLITAAVDGCLAGFLLLLKKNPDEIVIDLIAVGRNFRGRGIARDMILFTENTIPGIKAISAGTQLANLLSIKLYEGLGFRLKDSKYVFHFHQ